MVISLVELLKVVNLSLLVFSDDETNNSIRAAKKARKEHKLTNKRK